MGLVKDGGDDGFKTSESQGSGGEERPGGPSLTS
jgi:hypothetical protein